MAPQNYEGLNWALTGIAIALTIGRFGIRAHKSRRLYWDDFTHLLALVLLITRGGLNILHNDQKAAVALASKATPPASAAELLSLYQNQTRTSTVNNVFLHSIFWLVKLSFLLFYWRLFSTSTSFRKAWWVVLAFTFLTYWVPIGGVLATCTSARTLADYKSCTSGGGPTRGTRLWYSCAMNVATDLAIMALPLWMVKRLKITTYQKLGLAFIFSLACFCVAFDIARTIEAIRWRQVLFTILETNFVLFVSCLPTYRALITCGRQRSSYRPSKMTTWETIENGPLSGTRKEKGVASNTNAIHVTNDYLISREERGSYAVEAPGTTSRDLILPEPAHITQPTELAPYRSPV